MISHQLIQNLNQKRSLSTRPTIQTQDHLALFNKHNRSLNIQQPQTIANAKQKQSTIRQEPTHKEDDLTQNAMYLSKMKNTRKLKVNQGISTFSPQITQKIKVQMKGLNHFTNIVLKRLEKKTNKVSFSQFLQIKKEKDFQSKFKFIFPKKTAYNPKSKCEVAKNIESFCLGKNGEQVRKLSKSLVLQENKRALARSRFREPSKTYQRYPSVLSESFGVKGSLQISRMQLVR